MAPNASNLSDPHYGYDLVVSTTQESINAGLVQYLQNTKSSQPYSYAFFLVDESGTPSVQIGWDDLQVKTDGINPFDIPSGTQTNDPRIQKLFNIRFGCGVRLRQGIPPGMVKNVPDKGPQIQLPEPIVTLGSSATNVQFCMYCSDVTVINFTPPGGWANTGSWTWYTQPSGAPWYVKTSCDLVVTDLDKELNTTYFNNHPDEKAQLKARLNQFSGSAFSLQQLLFNLDAAVTQTVPQFEGVDNAKALYILRTGFISLWSAQAKIQGFPLVGVTAVPQVSDNSPLQVTALERLVSPVIDPATGVVIANPSADEVSATTLNYLCATNGNPLPGASTFNWNWVDPQALSDSSGVMAVKRKTMATFLVQEMMAQAKKSCIQPWTKVIAKDVVGSVEYQWSFLSNQEPTVAYTDSGPTVATISYYKEARASDSNAATYGELNITSSYSCQITLGPLAAMGKTFVNNTEFLITQHLTINVYSQWSRTGAGGNVVDKTYQDLYVVSVDEYGNLTTAPSTDPSKHTVTDNSNSGDASAAANFFTGVNDLIADVKSQSGGFLNAQIAPIPFDKLKNFVFPGAKVFSYKSAAFSDYHDLVSLITYVNPTANQFTTMSAMSIAPEVHAPIKPTAVSEAPAFNAVKALLAKQDHLTQPLDVNANGTNPDISTPPAGHTPRVGFSVPTKAASDLQVNGMTLSRPVAAVSASAVSEEQTGAGIQLSSSTEMMLNYVQGQLVEPTGKFEALQMSDGTALLFAIDTPGNLNVIREVVGQSQAGWTVNNISSTVITNHFPLGGATVSTFSANQSVMDGGTIGLGMAVRVNDSDTLFLSLGNPPNSSADWVSSPNWVPTPFDAPNGPSIVHITGISFSETDQGYQYIMVDILQNPLSSLKTTARYIIDPTSTTSKWIPHKLPFDVEEGTYQSVVGRCTDALIDGIYTAGTVQGAAQLAYVPMFNLSGTAAPMPTRLVIPGGAPASAIAAARNADSSSAQYGTSDLYAIVDSTLYLWTAQDQMNDSTAGRAIFSNVTLSGTDTLVALTRGGITTLFGRNGSDVVYYISCPVAKVSDSSAWSVPLPVVDGIERMASFQNVRDGGNTIFVAGGNNLKRLVQATNTEDKIWQAQPITLASPPQQKAISFKSYTTVIKVSDAQSEPLRDVPVSLTTPYRTPVYIEGLYYNLSPAAVTVKTNQTGTITIIQATTSIVGAVITATVQGATNTVNPMHGTFAKLSALADKTALQQAQFTTNAVAGGIIGTQQTASLLSSSVSDTDVQATADAIAKLKQAYDSTTTTTPSAPMFAEAAIAPAALVTSSSRSSTWDLGDAISMAAGDLFNWLSTGIDRVIDLIKDAATGFWQFIVKIANKVYTAVLNSAEAVIGAFEWVFDQIKTKIEDLIRYLEVLFNWDDIRRTKNIMHNMIYYYLQDSVDGIMDLKSKFDGSIANAQAAVANWAGIKDWSGLGDSASKPPGGNGSNPTIDQTPSSQMMSDHFKNNAKNMTIQGNAPQPSLVQNLLEDLMTAIQSEGQVFQETYDQLKALAHDFLQLSLTDILKRLAGILTEAVLGTAQVIVDALFNVIYHIAKSAVDLLDTKIHIPVLSDILNAIGVPDISFLDLITWIAATGVTVIYKLANNNEAPFPDDVASRALVDSTTWTQFAAVLNGGSVAPTTQMAFKTTNLTEDNKSPHVAVAAMAAAAAGPIPLSAPASKAVYTSGHAIAGFIAFTGNFLFFAEAMDESPDNAFGIPSAVMGVIGAVAAAGADVLVAKMPVENQAVNWVRRGTTAMTVASKIIFSGYVQGKLDPSGKLGFLKAGDNRKVGAVVNTVLILPALFCTCYHFYELSEKPASSEKSCAVIGETSSLVSYIGRVAYCVTVFDEDPETRLIPAGVMAGCNLVICGLETASALV